MYPHSAAGIYRGRGLRPREMEGARQKVDGSNNVGGAVVAVVAAASPLLSALSHSPRALRHGWVAHPPMSTVLTRELFRRHDEVRPSRLSVLVDAASEARDTEL